MKRTTAFILLGTLALGSIAAGITAANHEKRKARKHQPAATLLDLYKDNAACCSSILEEGGDN